MKLFPTNVVNTKRAVPLVIVSCRTRHKILLFMQQITRDLKPLQLSFHSVEWPGNNWRYCQHNNDLVCHSFHTLRQQQRQLFNN